MEYLFQILAIYDEPDNAVPDTAQIYSSRFAVNGTSSSSPSSVTATSVTPVESSFDSKLNIIARSSDGDVVEITNITEPPSSFFN